MKTLKICIIGRGNVATHLGMAMNGADVTIVNPHTLADMPYDSDIYIISVKDEAIEEVASRIPTGESVVAHTSGSVSMETIARHHRHAGVLYPLQTFTAGVGMDYSDIPVFIEATDASTADKLKNAAKLFSENVYDANSSVRKRLHIAAVFGCNFVNLLYSIAADELKDVDMPLEVLRPLSRRTLEKAFDSGCPDHVQTGPASRGDMSIIKNHIHMLENKPESQNIYRVLSQCILNKNHNSSKPT